MSPLFSAFKRKPKETRITVPHTPRPAQALLAAPSGSRAPDAPKSSSVPDAPNSSSVPDGPTSFNPPTAITDAIIARAPKGPNEWYCIDEDGDILATVPPCPAGFNPALFEVLVSETLLLAARISTIAGFLGADMPELEGMRPVTQRTGRRMGLSNKTFTTVVYDAALAAQHPPRGTATGYRFCSIGPYFQLGVEKAVAQWIKMVKECRRVGAAPGELPAAQAVLALCCSSARSSSYRESSSSDLGRLAACTMSRGTAARLYYYSSTQNMNKKPCADDAQSRLCRNHSGPPMIRRVKYPRR